MTPKELREAAQLIREWDGYIYPLDKSLAAAARNAAEHILATVRDDDDEPIDSTFLVSVGATTINNKHYWIDSAWGLYLDNGAWISMETETLVKTRRQFRQLCEGLGIKLKETT